MLRGDVDSGAVNPVSIRRKNARAHGTCCFASLLARLYRLNENARKNKRPAPGTPGRPKCL